MGNLLLIGSMHMSMEMPIRSSAGPRSCQRVQIGDPGVMATGYVNSLSSPFLPDPAMLKEYQVSARRISCTEEGPT